MNFKIVIFLISLLGIGAFVTKSPNLTHEESSGVVFQSTDGGKTWQDISTGLPKKIDPYTFYTENGNLLLGYEKGIFSKKNFHDATWQKEIFLNESVNQIFHSKTSPYIYNVDAGVLQKIENTGFWVPVLIGLKSKFILSILETQAGDILVGTTTGLFKSTDQGKSWKKTIENGNIYSLVEKDHIIMAGTDQGLIRSMNKGEKWETVLAEDGATISVKYIGNSFFAISQGYLIGKFSGELPSASANTLRRSKDGGKTWQHIDEHLAPFAFTYKVEDGRSPVRRINDVEGIQNYIFASIDNGVYRSADFGKTWELVLPSTENTYFSIATSGHVIYAVKKNAGC
jgi:photosystem II stability/assembly factor-like uncharacterized protein